MMSPGPPAQLPIGLRLAHTAHAVTQAFERAMDKAGGSASTWQVLLLVRSKNWDAQSRLAEAMGVTSATLTHHLNALEDGGLVRRWRESDNRRVQRVELTPEGVAMFDRLRRVAVRHDRRLRSVLGEEGTEQLADLLDRVRDGVLAPTRTPVAH
jgi:MarR family transcriptional regulator, transcriptional regulator for hemolysin